MEVITMNTNGQLINNVFNDKNINLWKYMRITNNKYQIIESCIWVNLMIKCLKKLIGKLKEI